MIATALSDAELLTATREGDEAAFTELYSRHQAAALRLANSYRRAADPDDLVNGAFERVLAAIRRGSGPTESFRAYLFVTLRRLASELIERDVSDPYDDVPEPVAIEEEAPVMEAAERAIVLQAYESLPDRWQAVLWQTTVEGKSPRDLAPILGMSANAAAALAYRAREKLRQAYLQAHLQAAPQPQCEPYRSQLGAFVRSGLSARDQGKVEAHLDDCNSCRDLKAELLGINSMLNRALLPMFLGAADVAALAAAGGAGALAGPLGLARKGASKARNNPGPTVVAAALAAALVAGLIVANRPGGEDPPDAAAGPIEEAPPATDAPDPDDPEVPPDPDDPDAPVDPDDPDAPPDPDDPDPPDVPAGPPGASADDPAGPGAPPGAPSGPGPTDPSPTEPTPTDPPGTDPPPTDPPPTDPPPSPPPTAPPPPSGQVVWNPGAQAVQVTLHNPGPGDTGLIVMQVSVSGGALMSSGPSGCTGVALLFLTECLVTAIPPGGTAVISQPVAGTGPGTYATVGCTLGALGLACDSVMPSSTVEMR